MNGTVMYDRAISRSRNRNRALAALTVMALALLGAGCGGSGASQTSAHGSGKLSKAAFLAKADANCATAAAAAPAVGRPPSSSVLVTNDAAAARYLDKLKPVADSLRDADKALTPPNSLRAAWSDYLSYVSFAADNIDSADKKIHAHDGSWLTDYNDIASNGIEIAYKAKIVGAAACAVPKLGAISL